MRELVVLWCKILTQRTLKIDHIYVFLANQHLKTNVLRVLLGTLLKYYVESFVSILTFALGASFIREVNVVNNVKECLVGLYFSTILLMYLLWRGAELSKLVECNF